MMNSDEFDGLLRERYTPQAPHNMAQRIIAASEKEGRSAKGFLYDIMDMIVFPRPGYAMAASLIVGLILGLEVAGAGLNMPDYYGDMASFLFVDEGEWL